MPQVWMCKVLFIHKSLTGQIIGMVMPGKADLKQRLENLENKVGIY